MIDLLREEDTRDELGIGTIRDAFADRFFPGTTTIQTRLRYFLFVPWLLQDLGSRGMHGAEFALVVRQHHNRLRRSLIEGAESEGVIGSRAGYAVQRLPSSIYWQGLRRLGILRFAGSEADYGRWVRRNPGTSKPLKTDDGEPTDDEGHGPWDPRIPSPPPSWLETTTFALRREDGEYLEHRVLMSAEDSLLAHLLDIEADPGETVFPWELLEPERLPSPLDEELVHARNFSEAILGAALLYNLMLSEEKNASEGTDRYRTRMAEWWSVIQERASAHQAWDRSCFWRFLAEWRAHVTPACRAFVETWVGTTAKAARVEDVMDDRRLRDLICRRERALKGARARLGNPRALDLWSGASGTAQLDYRWNRPVSGILKDLMLARRKGD